MRFELLDSLSPTIPEALIGQFDVVHLRMWAFIIRDNDPSALIRHASRLLSMFMLLRIQANKKKKNKEENHAGKKIHKEANTLTRKGEQSQVAISNGPIQTSPLGAFEQLVRVRKQKHWKN